MDFRQQIIEEVKQTLKILKGNLTVEYRRDLEQDIDKTMEFFAAYQQWKYYHIMENMGIEPSPAVLGRILCKVEYEEFSDTEVNYQTRLLNRYFSTGKYPDPTIVYRVYNNVPKKWYVRQWIEEHYDITKSPPTPRRRNKNCSI